MAEMENFGFSRQARKSTALPENSKITKIEINLEERLL